MRDHGGNLDAAMARYGGTGWLDLSTGINPRPYPVSELSTRAWTALPTRADMAALTDAARAAYGTGAQIVPMAGAQGAIQALPRIVPGRLARVLGPTYNEHAGALIGAGWEVAEATDPDALEGADLAVVVNPNNPDGRSFAPNAVRDIAARVGTLVVDESFCDVTPELSLAADMPPNAVVLRSFGKFFGLAGVRLGFALAAEPLAAKLRAEAGPWPVSGAAIEVGRRALADTAWHAATRSRLARDAARLDRIAEAAGWRLVGGTTLFRTYETGDAVAAQRRLAEGRIWSRIFPYSDGWLRLGLPDGDGWAQLAAAL
ncbi:L-threonine O-3-phosphate decarboxylase [Palleronia marisminoris]|uniref:threonine-phosphate decarboxylase n=1 Tax=Palleronia marisminoris TaxID=315423 RepID=A0A1Y5SJ76_9RHOB|nr:threonine-phosphate decarboxylase CobD [Palleronia marisminoris]SFG84771.1 L-threonine O-3-phosphate decarboxylase [Palleronia marisminoris]SLN42091.1 Threonine-phosphate decarboxylase [Palleronia marisminoris]